MRLEITVWPSYLHRPTLEPSHAAGQTISEASQWIVLTPATMDPDHRIMDALRSGQCCKLTRVDATTGIFACPILLYSSDGEVDDNLPEENRQDEVQGPGLMEPFQSLEPMNPQAELSADNLRSIMALCDDRNPLLRDEDTALPEKLSNAEWIEYLVKRGPTILTASAKNRIRTSRILRKLGSEIEVLRPGNNADDLGDWRDRSHWPKYLNSLVAELMTVEEGSSCEVRDAGAFVLTTFEYPALLELMAKEVVAQTES